MYAYSLSLFLVFIPPDVDCSKRAKSANEYRDMVKATKDSSQRARMMQQTRKGSKR
jgi:hypothetical protein